MFLWTLNRVFWPLNSWWITINYHLKKYINMFGPLLNMGLKTVNSNFFSCVFISNDKKSKINIYDVAKIHLIYHRQFNTIKQFNYNFYCGNFRNSYSEIVKIKRTRIFQKYSFDLLLRICYLLINFYLIYQ